MGTFMRHRMSASAGTRHGRGGWGRCIRRYRDFEDVFDGDALPLRRGKYAGYQLIRGALAAHASGCSFAVFCDGRRPELIEEWFGVLAAIRPWELRCRLKLLTWQELATVLPVELQQFLAMKYGIVPREETQIPFGDDKNRADADFRAIVEMR